MKESRKESKIKSMLIINLVVTALTITFYLFRAIILINNQDTIVYSLLLIFVLSYNSWLIKSEIFGFKIGPILIFSIILFLVAMISMFTGLNINWTSIIWMRATMLFNIITYARYYFYCKKNKLI